MKRKYILAALVLMAAPLAIAASFFNSTNMNLPIPIPGVAPGPDWANDINASLQLIDAHDHSPGKGVPVTPLGINITSDLSFNGHSATSLASDVFSIQASDPIANACVYSKGVDLFYKDGNGNVIQITQNGGVAGAPGSISNLTPPASASYVASQGTFVWEQNTGVAANMDNATVILRYPGSYPVPTGNYVALQAPTSLSGGYSLTFPNAAPIANGSFLTFSTTGLGSYTTISDLPDNVTIQATGGKLSTKNTFGQYPFRLNGPYSHITVPGTGVDAYLMFESDVTITAVWISNEVAGTSGTTEFDLKQGTSGGAFTTILSTTGKITSAASGGVWTDSGTVIGSQTGVTKPVLSVINITAGTALRMDILNVMGGTARDAAMLVQYTPR